ncbi:MAG TPA: carboxypeptidase-like regulatory domain-containing protein, partial [Casimicrobiaceae bacterium]|nr:carboxypeptidase-like regulatory domain-containing protein [Casimicrobiaceae bacterium]
MSRDPGGRCRICIARSFQEGIMQSRFSRSALASLVLALACAPSPAATIAGRVMGAGAPIAGSTVTLWAASSGSPRQLAQARTSTDGQFSVSGDAGTDSTLYLTAQGGRTASMSADNPAIGLITAVGASPPANVTINEM